MSATSTPRLAIVDTCVVLKWFKSDREGSLADATELLESHLRGDLKLAAPDSMPLEAANALRHSGISNEHLAEFPHQLADLGIELFASGEKRLSVACLLARAWDMTVYDAVFLGLAVELDRPLYTADGRAFSSIPSGFADVRVLAG